MELYIKPNFFEPFCANLCLFNISEQPLTRAPKKISLAVDGKPIIASLIMLIPCVRISDAVSLSNKRKAINR